MSSLPGEVGSSASMDGASRAPEGTAVTSSVPSLTSSAATATRPATLSVKTLSAEFDGVRFMQYPGEEQLQGMIDLISLDLSEPYSIFTYRYFLNQWPYLCFNVLAPATAAETGNADFDEARMAAACGGDGAGEVATAGVTEERVVGTIICKQAHASQHGLFLLPCVAPPCFCCGIFCLFLHGLATQAV